MATALSQWQKEGLILGKLWELKTSFEWVQTHTQATTFGSSRPGRDQSLKPWCYELEESYFRQTKTEEKHFIFSYFF